jgi:hypothetical protein
MSLEGRFLVRLEPAERKSKLACSKMSTEPLTFFLACKYTSSSISAAFRFASSAADWDETKGGQLL